MGDYVILINDTDASVMTYDGVRLAAADPDFFAKLDMAVMSYGR